MMKPIYQKSILSGMAVGRLRLEDDFKDVWAATLLRDTIPAEPAAGAEDPLRDWRGAGVADFLRQAESIADGGCSSLPAQVDIAQHSFDRRFATWSARLSAATSTETLEHVKAWWLAGTTDGIAGLQRGRHLIAHLQSNCAARVEQIASGAAAGKNTQAELDRERSLSAAAAQAIDAQFQGESRLKSAEGVAAMAFAATLILTVLTGESLLEALVFASVAGGSCWLWMKIGWRLHRRSDTSQPGEFAARHVNARLKAALVADWTSRASAEGLAAELRVLNEAMAKLGEIKELSTVAKIVRLLADAPTDCVSDVPVPWLNERRPGDVVITSKDAVKALANTQTGQRQAQIVDAVNRAVNDLVAAGSAPSWDQLVQATSICLPDLRVADVLGAVVENARGKEQVVGHLGALVSTVTASAGRLPADLVLNPVLSPKTVTFGLPGGLEDPLANVINRHFPTAALIQGSDPSAVEVIVDIQNVRFDQLLMAEDAKAAYDKTSEGERKLWHFPPLPLPREGQRFELRPVVPSAVTHNAPSTTPTSGIDVSDGNPSEPEPAAIASGSGPTLADATGRPRLRLG